ncbi:YSC84-related protein [Corallincola platygyrae]|uniref:YSC84-related protein n=1 Tax=Corallincola platygyrae TaxID=1193278 RepID=A0ABW4XT17_9GAMM
MKNLWLALVLFVTSIGTVWAESVEEQRANVMKMHDKALADLYEAKPDVKQKLQSAPGYAVFKNADVNLLIAAVGGGYGVVNNNSSGKKTYMKMGTAGIGLGLGVKDFRAVFIFKTEKVMNSFIESGWEFGGEADAAAKAGEDGGQASGKAVIGDIEIYQMTESGLALQATIRGTKYWQDDELN